MLTLKLFPNRTLTQTLILTPKKQMKKARMNISHSRFILFKLKIFGEIVTTYSVSLTISHAIIPQTFLISKILKLFWSLLFVTQAPNCMQRSSHSQLRNTFESPLET